MIAKINCQVLTNLQQMKPLGNLHQSVRYGTRSSYGENVIFFRKSFSLIMGYSLKYMYQTLTCFLNNDFDFFLRNKYLLKF